MPAMSTRRSSRLNGAKLDARHHKDEAPSARKHARPKATTAKPYEKPTRSRSALPAAASRSDAASTSVNLRRSLRISAEELVRRETALLSGEKELELRVLELDKAAESLRRKQEETARMISRFTDREAQAMLSQLEQSFVCPLCYEVFSAPHTLNAPNCGHTFCGLCILKWFFSRLHLCGAWHESVDCPMCRAVMSPRSESTFPFIPNRLATTTIASLTERLSAIPANTAMMVKREENDDIPVASGSKSSRPRNCSRGAAPAKTEDDEMPETPDIDGWREGGYLRSEWLKKDNEGRREMNDLLKSWRGLKPDDLLGLKKRLGV